MTGNRVGLTATSFPATDSAGSKLNCAGTNAHDNQSAADSLPAWLQMQAGFGSVDAVGHRVVHGLARTKPDRHGLKLSGFIAWLLWRSVYLLTIPTFSRKARLHLKWNRAIFCRRP